MLWKCKKWKLLQVELDKLKADYKHKLIWIERDKKACAKLEETIDRINKKVSLLKRS